MSDSADGLRQPGNTAARAVADHIKKYRVFFAGFFLVLCLYAGFRLLLPYWKTRFTAENVAVHEIPFESARLSNGLEVVLHRDPSAPIVSLEVTYHVGSKDEPPGRYGLAHLAEHAMLLRTGHLDRNFNDQLQRIGAWQYNAATDYDRTRFYMTVPKQSLGAALWIESERMGFVASGLTEEKLVEARKDVLNELNRNRSGMDIVTDEALARIMYPPDHPYAHLPGGTARDLESISLEDLREWIARNYHPDNAVVVIAGDLDTKGAIKEVEKNFSPLQTRSFQRQRWTDWIPAGSPGRRYAINAGNSNAVTLVWAIPGSRSADLDYLDLARHMLEARLIRTLVNDRQLATSVRADLRPRELCSLLTVTANLRDIEDERAVTAAIDAQLRGLAEKTGSAELDAAKNRVLASLSFESSHISGPYARTALLSSGAAAGDEGQFNTVLRRIQETRSSDVSAAVQRWMVPGAATIIAMRSIASPPAPVRAADTRPSIPPAVEISGAPPVNTDASKLSNGLRVTLAGRSDPVSTAVVLWRRPAYFSPRDEMLSKIALQAITKGTSDRNASQLQRIRDLNSHFLIDTTADYFGVGIELPSAHLLDGLAALSGMLVNIAFDERRVESVRAAWIARLNKQQPSSWNEYALSLARVLAFCCDSNAASIDSGDRSLTAQDIREWLALSLRPDKGHLIVIGASPANLQTEVGKLFGSWRNPISAGERSSDRAPAAKARLYVADRPGAEHTIVATSTYIKSGNPEIGSLISWSLGRQINEQLRVKSHVSYETFAGLWNWDAAAAVYTFADSASSRVPDAIRLEQAFLEHPFGSRDSRFCDEEFPVYRATVLTRYWQASESPRFLLDLLVDSAVRGQLSPPSPVCRELTARAEETMSSASKRTVWVVVGDAHRIVPDLQRAGFHPVRLHTSWWVGAH